MTLMQFIGRWLGDKATAPGGAGGQCVDLANLWALNLRQQPVRANAVDWPSAASPTVWRWTSNTPQGVPPPGALVVWRANVPAAGTGPAGHIAIATPLSDQDDLVTFDQDFPWGALCSLTIHRRYAGVWGWLTLQGKPAGREGGLNVGG